MQKRLRRFTAVLRKETIQFLRDRRTLVLIIGVPLIELFLFAYAVNLTVYHLPMAVVDQSRDRKSREFVQALVNSQYFDHTMQAQSLDDAQLAIDRGQVKVGVVIPPHFAASLDRGEASVLILLDGSESFSVQSGFSAATAVAQNFGLSVRAEEISREAGWSAGLADQPVSTSTRVLYNPDLKDLWFLLPAIIAMIMQTLAVGQAALVVVKEREAGTNELLLATPIRPLELMGAKLIPLLGFCLVMISFLVGLGLIWFKVPIAGSVWHYFWLSLLFIVSSLALGLLISALARSQKQAQQITTMLMLFSMLLTGLIYSRDAMPAIPHLIGDLLPLTYFIRISRAIMTKGVSLTATWNDALVLVIYGVIVIVLAGKSSKKRLD